MGTLSKVKALCEERGVKISRLERECGFSNASLAGLRNEDITFDRVVKIARYFNVQLEYFADDTVNQSDENENKIIAIYRNLNDDGKQKILDYVNDLNDTGRYIKNYKSALVSGK